MNYAVDALPSEAANGKVTYSTPLCLELMRVDAGISSTL
jgi:hypothetical protein